MVNASLTYIVGALALAVSVPCCATPAFAQDESPSVAQPRDGSRDFDWEIGSWTTQLRYLPEPLAGSTRWVEYRGTSEVRAIMGARANLVELSVEGPAGKIEGVSLRLYNPKARQWTLNFANVRSGLLTSPVTGAFDGEGRGVFYGVDSVGDRTVLVRFLILDVGSNSARFEQAFSADGGANWETNWVAVDSRR
ncbi:hypothetical protein [Sphingopyxis sp.]|uniref:hypothetical protein n=1 Tax=Sphingopyxis sp. TaxID=1908224 RepID=UPI002D764EA4|nr:hypothetical protein [Sphingopyxis sp.]HET6524398.1 hypothetical protein [Sphingopyxis sp.]